MPIQRARNSALLTYISNLVSNTNLYTERTFNWVHRKAAHLVSVGAVERELFQKGIIKSKKHGNSYGDDFDFDFDSDFDSPRQEQNYDVPKRMYKEVILKACELGNRRAKQDTDFAARLNMVKNVFALDAVEFEIFKLYAYLKRSNIVHTFVNDILSSSNLDFNNFDIRRCPEVIGITSEAEIEEALSKDATLIRSGIIALEEKGFDCSSVIYTILNEPIKSEEEMRQALVGQKEETSIRFKSFGFLGDELLFVKKLLTSSITCKTAGINILLVGPVGTGKTEFSKAVAKEIGVNIYNVCSGKGRDEPTRKDRLTSLKTADFVLGANQGVLLFDEAQDVFIDTWFCSDRISKSFINQQLENNLHPVIWTTNSTENIDLAHIRRFTYVLRFSNPDEVVRKSMWNKACVGQNLALSKAELTTLAKSYQVPPAIISTAVRNAAAVDGGVKELKMSLLSFEKALGAKFELPAANTADFNPKLLNTDINLEKLAEQLSFAKQSFSLCLYGAPGTGKSAYARYIADKLSMPVIEKRASDLLDKYVGETEKLIAAAFGEARDKKALLIFDEADSLLRSRTNAFQSHEVTRVNEILTQMERHPLPFVCTTNLMDGLDKASLRRFTFKVKYYYLTTAQVVMAFAHFFNLTVDEDEVYALSHLTPGDFIVVKKQADILGCISDKAEVIKMLRGEIENKGEIPSQATIGFLN